MKTLNVCGYTVYAPICPICKKDDDVVVQDHDDGSWAYRCKCCGHELTYEELNEQRY